MESLRLLVASRDCALVTALMVPSLWLTFL